MPRFKTSDVVDAETQCGLQDMTTDHSRQAAWSPMGLAQSKEHEVKLVVVPANSTTVVGLRGWEWKWCSKSLNEGGHRQRGRLVEVRD